ncbi:hypothetical protein EDM22_08280 [Agromyces tardus]|uniref:Uncharacterized protein n=1 Tax=Agromyces tardus TaxID=2583849 RepID=A0A3M8AFU2_9MICO|nr:hypothetical protein EDM22_08280 [Agromyces tardus]
MTVVVVYYFTSWVTYGTEICASFAPEYKDTARDTSRALPSSSAFMLALFTFVFRTVQCGPHPVESL